ncbi:hypothetical protein DUM79_10005 [Escherichia coli]|nr:hypothetical protein [Escherichia coli]
MGQLSETETWQFLADNRNEMYIMPLRCAIVTSTAIPGYKDRRSEIEMVCLFDCVISGLFIKA